MVGQFLEAIHIYENGKFHAVRAAVVGVPLLLFLLWRLSSHGVYDAEGVMRTEKFPASRLTGRERPGTPAR